MTKASSRFADLALYVALLLGLATAYAHAQSTTSDAQLIGAPVFAGDGIKIGQVVDVSTTDGHIDQIRVLTGSALGFGERTVAIPQPAFMIHGGRVILPDLTSEDVQALPNASSENVGPGSEER